MCLAYISPIGSFDMPFARHDHDLEYLQNSRQVIALASAFHRRSHFELIFFKRDYDRLYSVYDGLDQWCDLDYEGRHRPGSHYFCLLGWNYLEVFVLLYRDRDCFYVSVPVPGGLMSCENRLERHVQLFGCICRTFIAEVPS